MRRPKVVGQTVLSVPTQEEEERFTGKAKKSKRNPFTAAAMKLHLPELEEIIAAGEWERAKPIHFVLVYLRMFQHVYGVEAHMTPNDRRNCAFMASRCMREHFGNDPSAFASYLRWVWRREKSREKWRRDNGRGGYTLGYRFQFASDVLNEYRVAIARDIER